MKPKTIYVIETLMLNDFLDLMKDNPRFIPIMKKHIKKLELELSKNPNPKKESFFINESDLEKYQFKGGDKKK